MKRKPASLEAGFYVSASDTKCLLLSVDTPVCILLCQRVNQAGLVRTAPSRGQVIAFCRVKAVASDGDVVEVGRTAFPQTQRVNSWVNEAGRFIAVGFRLLISQSQVAGPHGRGKTGPAIKVFRASGLVGADVKGKIRVCRDVRAVAIFVGPLLALVITPLSFCQLGIANLSGEMPPPPSTQTVSELQPLPAPLVTRSVPPTQMTNGDSIGHMLVVRHAPLSPAASKKLWPCAANFMKNGSSDLGSTGVQNHDELKFKGNGLCEDMLLNMAVSLLLLTYS